MFNTPTAPTIDHLFNPDAPNIEIPAYIDPRIELQQVILAALSEPNCDTIRTRYSFANSTLQDEYFTDPYLQIYHFLVYYHNITGDVPSIPEFDELLEASSRLAIPQRIKYSTVFHQLRILEVSEARFHYSCKRLQERWRDSQFSTILDTSQQIHAGIYSSPTKPLSGFEDAVTYFRQNVATVERLTTDHFAEGSIHDEVRDVMSEYITAKTGKSTGILSGFGDLDIITNGFQPGELLVCGAYTSEGKSKITYNVAYDAAYNQGRHILIGTNEATREQVRRNMVVRHSHNPKFGLQAGLSYNDIKFGHLDETGENALKAILQDLKAGTSTVGGYGEVYIFHIPEKATIDYVMDVFERRSKLKTYDMLFLDYLGLMGARQRRISRREELDDLIIATKQFAINANQGKGIPIWTPWQLSREAWKAAQESHGYDKASFADTSQIEKASDLLLTILKNPTSAQELLVQVQKFRDGESGGSFKLYADFGTSYVTTQASNISSLGF